MFWEKRLIFVRSVWDLDNTKISWRQKYLPSTRKLIQLYSAMLHNAHVRGFIDGEIYQGKAKYACVPGLNCYSCPAAAGACPLGALQNALASAGHRAGWYIFGMLILFGTILGRTICGWLCPMGLIQELLHRIPTFKIKKSSVTRALSGMKYVILTVFAVAVPLWYGFTEEIPVPGFCKYICPAGTLEGAIGLLSNPVNSGKFSMLGIYFTRKFVILTIIVLACIFCYRSFCRFLCPLGAIYSLFNRFCLVHVEVDQTRCNHCGACVRYCGMDVRRAGDHECIQCAGCVDVCHQQAISLKAGKMTLKAPLEKPAGVSLGKPAGADKDRSEKTVAQRHTGRIAWAAALAVLCAALYWFNAADPSVRAADRSEAKAAENTAADNRADPSAQPADMPGTAKTENEAGLSAQPAGGTETAKADKTDHSSARLFESDAPVGNEPGMQLQDFTIECLDGTSFHLAETRGKVTIINLWATYCAPCVRELPYFNDLYMAKEGDIAMLAVHSSMVIKDPADFLADKGLNLPFAVDSEENLIWNITGGSSTLPQTIVLNRRGEVIYNQQGSVTPEMLEVLYEQASEEQ